MSTKKVVAEEKLKFQTENGTFQYMQLVYDIYYYV